MKNTGIEDSFVPRGAILNEGVKVTTMFNKDENVMALRKAMGLTGRVLSSPSEKSIAYTKTTAEHGVMNFSIKPINMMSDEIPSTVER